MARPAGRRAGAGFGLRPGRPKFVRTPVAFVATGAADLRSTSTLVTLSSTNFPTGAAVLTSTSVVVVAGARLVSGTAVLSSASAFSSAGSTTVLALANLASTSFLEVQTTTALGRVNLRSTSTLTVFTLNVSKYGAATLASSSSLVVAGTTTVTQTVTLRSTSYLSVETVKTGVSNLRSTSKLNVQTTGAPDTRTIFTFTFGLTVGQPTKTTVGDTTQQNATQTPPSHSDSGTYLVLTMTGYFQLNIPQVVYTTHRAVAGINVTTGTPVVINGKPVVPAIWIKSDSSFTTVYGSTHIHVTPDPDPDVAVPPGTGNQYATYRWVATDLPYTGDYFETWPSHGAGPDFHSLFPYRPKVREHIHYGAGDNNHTYSKVVFFNNTYVEHMWTDLGANQSQPYTWVFAGFVLSYPNGQYGHFLLDGGKAVPGSSIPYVRDDHIINDGLTTRSCLLAKRDSIIAATDLSLTHKYAKAVHSWAPRPKMYAVTFNGANTYVAEMDTHKQNISKGKVSVHSARHFVMGRALNHISDNYASHMGLFEVRYFNRGLSPTELKAQYRQLAATYKFNLY